MDKNHILKVTGLFSLLALVFFSPVVLTGKVLAPGGDALDYYYPLRAYVAELVRQGSPPLWNPHIFSGFPLLADIEVGAFYPPNWLFLFLSAPVAMNLVVLLSYVIAGLSTYLYTRAIGATPFGAVVSGLTFMLSGFMVSHLAHTSIINAASWLPLLLFFLERLRQRVTWPLVMGGALTLGVQVLGSHPQIIPYSLMVSGLYVGFFGLAQRPPGGRAGYLLGAAGVLGGGLLIAACQLLPTWELAPHSVRATISYDAFIDNSLPSSHLLLFLFPCFFGGCSDSFYLLPWWGYKTGPVELSGYVGIIPLLLTLIVLLQARRSRHVLFWLLYASFALFLALGGNTPFYKIMYHVPVYNLFRAPARHLLEVDLALAILAGLGVTFLSQEHRRRAALLVALAAAGVLAVVSGLCLLLVREGQQLAALVHLMPSNPAQVFTFTNPALSLPFALALLICFCWLCYARRPHRGTQTFALFLLFADLCSFGQFYYWRFSSPTINTLQRHPPAIRSLKEIDPEIESYRFLSYGPEWLKGEDLFAINRPNGSILRGIANASGSSSLMLARYGEMVRGIVYETGTTSDPSILHEDRALDLLNVRYLFVSDQLLSPQPAFYLDGVGFSPERLEISLARSHPEQAELSLPPVWCSEVKVTFLADLPSGFSPRQPLAQITVWTKEGQKIEGLLAAKRTAWIPGVNSGEDHYQSVLHLGGRHQIVKIRLLCLTPFATLHMRQLTFFDAATQRSLSVPSPGQTLRPPRSDQVEIPLPQVACSALEIVSSLGHSALIPQGEVVGRVRLWTREGRVLEKLLRAGEDTSEWAWERPDVKAKVRHRQARIAASFPVAEEGFLGHRYVSRWELGGSFTVEGIKIERLSATVTLNIANLSFFDSATQTSTSLGPEGKGLGVELSRVPPLPLHKRLAAKLGIYRPRAPTSTPEETDISFPPVECSAIVLVSSLSNSLQVPQGEVVGRVRLWTREGGVLEKLLRAGEDTSEWAWEQPEVQAEAKHQKAPVAESFPVTEGGFLGHRYVSRWELGGSFTVERIKIERSASAGLLHISGLSLADAFSSTSLPLLYNGPDLGITLKGTNMLTEIEFPAPSVLCSAVAIVSTLSHSLLLEQGQPVAKVSVQTAEGKIIEQFLRAGVHTSEWAWERPDVRARVKHGQVSIAESFPVDGGRYQGHEYIGRVDLGGRYQVEKIKIAAIAPDAILSLARLSFYDEGTGVSTPLSPMRFYLADRTRWKQLFSAEGAAVYKNLKAMPRVWLVPQVKVLLAPDVLKAIRTGKLPDGTPFDPTRVALVEEGDEKDFLPLDPEARVEVRDSYPTRLTLESHSRTPAFLVSSEIAYPGWRAEVDGEPVPILRTSYTLRGIVLPAGTHRIDFFYKPFSFMLGVAISGTTLLALLGISLAGFGRRRRSLALKEKNG